MTFSHYRVVFHERPLLLLLMWSELNLRHTNTYLDGARFEFVVKSQVFKSQELSTYVSILGNLLRAGFASPASLLATWLKSLVNSL